MHSGRFQFHEEKEGGENDNLLEKYQSKLQYYCISRSDQIGKNRKVERKK